MNIEYNVERFLGSLKAKRTRVMARLLIERGESTFAELVDVARAQVMHTSPNNETRTIMYLVKIGLAIILDPISGRIKYNPDFFPNNQRRKPESFLKQIN